MATISEALSMAMEHHQLGRLNLAEQIYRQVLEVDPDQAVAIHLLGLIAHQAGKIPEAELLYRRALGIQPDYAEAHSNLAAALKQTGKLDEAIPHFRRVVELRPGLIQGYQSLGYALVERGRADEAVACFQHALKLDAQSVVTISGLGLAFQAAGKLAQAESYLRHAVELSPSDAGVRNNLGNLRMLLGDFAGAVESYSQAVRMAPGFVEGYYNLGNAFMAQKMPEQAVSQFRQAIQRKPDHAQAHNNLGVALSELGKFPEAISCFRQALRLVPGYIDAQNNLRTALHRQEQLGASGLRSVLPSERTSQSAEWYLNQGTGFLDQRNPEAALTYLRQAIALDPKSAKAYNTLGAALGMGRRETRDMEEMISCFQRAIELKPDDSDAYSNLGIVLKDQGRLDDAIECFRSALKCRPQSSELHSNLLYTQHFRDQETRESLFEEHRRWDQQHGLPLAKFIRPHLNDRSPGRRLRIGYISPDFYRHPVGRFMLPLLTTHDRNQFEISCYSSVRNPDPMTDQCRAHSDRWQNTNGLADAQMADLIRNDQIDILVDLTMHMANHRLLVFARKPAPVQVTYLAYCGTTGLSAIDYRITDPYIDPVGTPEPYYSEKSVHLPETYWCYEPTELAPPVKTLPALESGSVCFGSLNNFCKVTPAAFSVWCQILRAVPGSTLLIHAYEGSHRERAISALVEHGIAPDRLKFTGFQPAAEYFGTYQKIDIALDPFPYGGGTTSCDALWMGVPVVSLAGKTGVGRGGLSILSNLGLADLVAEDRAAYVRIAAELANDLPRLADLRKTLRATMQASPLMNQPRFTKHLELAYRTMWVNWCNT